MCTLCPHSWSWLDSMRRGHVTPYSVQHSINSPRMNFVPHKSIDTATYESCFSALIGESHCCVLGSVSIHTPVLVWVWNGKIKRNRTE